MVWGFFLRTNFDILSSLTTLSPGNGNSEISTLITVDLESLTKHFTLVSDTDACPALHPEGCGRVQEQHMPGFCTKVSLLVQTACQEAQLISDNGL